MELDFLSECDREEAGEGEEESEREEHVVFSPYRLKQGSRVEVAQHGGGVLLAKDEEEREASKR